MEEERRRGSVLGKVKVAGCVLGLPFAQGSSKESSLSLAHFSVFAREPIIRRGRI